MRIHHKIGDNTWISACGGGQRYSTSGGNGGWALFWVVIGIPVAIWAGLTWLFVLLFFDDVREAVGLAFVALLVVVGAFIIVGNAWGDATATKEAKAAEQAATMQRQHTVTKRGRAEKICRDMQRYYEERGYTLTYTNTVPCVVCNVMAGNPCLDEYGNVAADMHVGRFTAWNTQTGDVATPVAEYLRRSAEIGNPARDEARAFVARLLEGGTQVKIAPNARDLEVSGSGAKLQGENLATLNRLKPHLLELLQDG